MAAKKTAKKATTKTAKKGSKKPARKSTAKAAKKKADSKTTEKPTAKSVKEAAAVSDEALKKFRDKTEKRLEVLISESLQTGEELFGAIDAARNRYTYEWEKMRRRHLSIQMAVWKVRPSRDNVDELMEGIDRELKELETAWKKTGKEVKKAIALLGQ